MINIIKGDLIKLAGTFDVIAHGCNCMCAQKNGLAPQMVKAFHTDEYELEHPILRGDINKLGNIDYRRFYWNNDHWSRIAKGAYEDHHKVIVVNAYTQYNPGKNLDYEALTLCMRKIAFEFDSLHVGLPRIGSGLAGGDPFIIQGIIEVVLKNCEVTIVEYE